MVAIRTSTASRRIAYPDWVRIFVRPPACAPSRAQLRCTGIHVMGVLLLQKSSSVRSTRTSIRSGGPDLSPDDRANALATYCKRIGNRAVIKQLLKVAEPRIFKVARDQ